MVEALRSALPQHLQRHLHNARELARQSAATPTSSLPSKITAFDSLLGGGLVRGQMVELIGHRSSGRFSTALSVLAAATAAGEATALVDLGDVFDPRPAAAAGAALERLLWIRPAHLKQALIATEMLLAGGFPLVIVDLGHPPVPGGRGAEAAWLRLARAAESHAAVLLVSSPYRVSGTAAAGVVKATRGQPLWSSGQLEPRLLLGLSSRLTLEKLRGRQGTRSESLYLRTPGAATFETVVTRNGEASGYRTRSAGVRVMLRPADTPAASRSHAITAPRPRGPEAPPCPA